MTVFEAYITNLGKYAEGQLVGETLKFPATTEEVQSLLKNIGVDGVRYEEFFITAFDGDVMGLYDYLTEYENLDELNHLAHLISELDSDEIETLEAALNKGDHTSSVADIINLVHNLDCYDLHPGVTDDETLGRIYVEDMELLDVPDNVLPYFDFEAYGRDMRINEGGHFAPTGYLTRSGDFKEVYHGIEDIPAEHRIFAYPQLVQNLHKLHLRTIHRFHIHFSDALSQRSGLHQKAVQWPFGSAKRRDPVPVPQCHPHGHLS